MITEQRTARWRRVLTQFIAGQVSLQAINALTGLLILRWLTLADYAEYSVAIAFQTTMGMLVDLGFAGSVVALVGDRGGDARVVGSYIRSVKHVRARTLAVGAFAAVLAFPLVTRTQPWSMARRATLLSTIVAALVFQSWSVYSAPLRLHGRMNAFYIPQVLTGVCRLALCSVLARASLLTGTIATAIAALSLLVNGVAFRYNARPNVQEPSRPDPAVNAEMLRYILPLTPGILYTALQGQITVVVITMFGKTTSIAEVAALGRLGQLFLLLNAFNAILLEPFIARLPARQLRRRYVQALGSMIVIAVLVSAASFAVPGPLVWLLGSRYAHLRVEIGWIVSASCLNFVAGAAWTMNSARKWLSWQYTGFYIAVMMSVQVIAASMLDLATTHNVVMFSLFAAAASLLVHASVGMKGLASMGGVSGSRELRLETTSPQEGTSPASSAGGIA